MTHHNKDGLPFANNHRIYGNEGYFCASPQDSDGWSNMSSDIAEQLLDEIKIESVDSE